MENSLKVYNSVVSKPKETIVSVDLIAKETSLTYYVAESIARALTKDGILKLAAICESGESPSLGVMNGKAKMPEYYFCWSYLKPEFVKECLKNTLKAS